jgi:hypothetical protein
MKEILFHIGLHQTKKLGSMIDIIYPQKVSRALPK